MNHLLILGLLCTTLIVANPFLLQQMKGDLGIVDSPEGSAGVAALMHAIATVPGLLGKSEHITVYVSDRSYFQARQSIRDIMKSATPQTTYHNLVVAIVDAAAKALNGEKEEKPAWLQDRNRPRLFPISLMDLMAQTQESNGRAAAKARGTQSHPDAADPQPRTPQQNGGSGGPSWTESRSDPTLRGGPFQTGPNSFTTVHDLGTPGRVTGDTDHYTHVHHNGQASDYKGGSAGKKGDSAGKKGNTKV